MKIIVYTIMKNEISNIEPWLENIKDADGIYVLDTGSTDGSWEKIQQMQSQYPQLVVKQQLIEPFRFDTARNINLDMVPNEEDIICWTIDLDERFIPDWYQITKQVVKQHPLFYKLHYDYAPNHFEDGSPTELLIYDKCHQRIGAYWSLPIHEQLAYNNNNYIEGYVDINTNGAFVHHYQTPSNNRDQYIDLLKQRIKDNMYDIEAMHHLTTELTKLGDNQGVLDTLIQQYSRGLMCGCTWMDTICGNIADRLWSLHNISEDVEMWYKRAINYNPSLRTYYIKYALYLCYGTSNSRPKEAIELINKMLELTINNQESWKEIDGNWTWKPDDTLGIAYSWAGDYVKALAYFENALNLTVDSHDRNYIQEHIDFCKNKLNITNIDSHIDTHNYAYVTILSNNAYINGLVVLYYSLKQTNPKYPLYAIVTPNISQENRNILTKLGVGIIDKQQLQPPKMRSKDKIEYIESFTQEGWHAALVKLEIFNLLQFDKVVYLDSDMYICQNIDDLFEKPHLSAVQDLCGFILNDPNNHHSFNSGVMVVEPNKKDYNNLVNILNNHDFGDQLVHDQLVMWINWPDWEDRKELHLSNYYNIWTTYFSTNDIHYYYPQSIKILHIIDRKPWTQSKQYFEQCKQNYPCYAELCLKYIDILNWTINDLKSKRIESSDLKIIE